MKNSDADHVRRAMKAWFRAGNTAQPSNCSSVYEAGGRRYVELWNVNGTLAVYRIESTDRLKRLKRWPEPLAGAPAHTANGVDSQKNRRDLAATVQQTIDAFRTGGSA